MELSLIGLQNAGKTSLVNVIAVRASNPILFLYTSIYTLSCSRTSLDSLNIAPQQRFRLELRSLTEYFPKFLGFM